MTSPVFDSQVTPTSSGGVVEVRMLVRPSAEQLLYEFWRATSAAQARGSASLVSGVLPVRVRRMVLGTHG